MKRASPGLANLKIVSATYGPHEGRRLLTGELSTSLKAKAPYERDVLPFLRSLLSRSSEVSNNTSDVEDEEDTQTKGISSRDGLLPRASPQHTPSFVLSKAKNSITILDGVKSMNAIFGDPCPGTTKRLEIKYIYDDYDACGNAALSATSICTSSFAEHEKVVLKRKRHTITSQNDGRQNDSPKSVDIKLSSWKLDCETSEIVVPLLLPYLAVKQRVMCQSVCKLWKSIIRKWGVATSIDVADPSFANFNRSLLQGIINHSYYSLHTLVLNDFRDLREEDLLPAIPHLRKLRNLDISRCTLITDITLLKISLHLFDTIEVLYMKGLKKVSDIGMNSVCDHCWRLRILELSEVPITDDSGINIGNKLTRLEALYMRDNFRLTNKSIDVITSRCHKLSQLTLWGCMRVHNLSINIENLVLLNLWGCHGLSDSAAENMTVLVNLRSLILSECHRLTDKFIFTLATAVPQLYHLHLRYLRRITDASICCIASNMMNIYTLDLTFCTKISARAITDLIAVRPNLSEVRLSSCRQISEEGAYTILREASKAFNCLSILDLQNCFDSDDIDADNEAINTRISRAFKDVGFTEKVTGFFFRPVVWSSELKDRIEHQILESTIGVDIKRRTSDADLIYGLDR